MPTKYPQNVVDAIREAEGTQREIAAKFGVHQSHVSRIKSSKRRTMRLTV